VRAGWQAVGSLFASMEPLVMPLVLRLHSAVGWKSCARYPDCASQCRILRMECQIRLKKKQGLL